jgi:Crinkler effector protein N-terminal domain
MGRSKRRCKRCKRTKSSRKKKDADKKPDIPASHTSKPTTDPKPANENIVERKPKVPAGHTSKSTVQEKPKAQIGHFVTFFCLLYNHPFDRIFDVGATTGESVLELQQRIVDKMSDDLEGFSDLDLTLWSVSIPLRDNDALSQFKPQNDEINNISKLDKWSEISTEFPIRKNGSLHIVVQFPQSNRSHVNPLAG